MIEKASEILKWFVSLSADKAIIALLSILVIYFGWNNFQTEITNEVLQNERNSANVDCVTKIAQANIDCQDKMNLQTENYQKRYDEYRDKVEQDNLERIRVWKLKYDVVERKLEDAQNKQAQTDELISKITKKLK